MSYDFKKHLKIHWWHPSNIIGWWNERKWAAKELKSMKKFQLIAIIPTKTVDENDNVIAKHYYRLFEDGFGERKVVISSPYEAWAKSHHIYQKYVIGWKYGKYDNANIQHIEKEFNKQT